MRTTDVTLEKLSPTIETRVIEDLRRRLATTRWTSPEGAGWELGAPRQWLSPLVEDWQQFDFEAFQVELATLDHFRATIDGQTVVHFVYAPGRGPRSLPLVLTHGWPGSFLEYLDVLPLLTDPGAHGGDPSDAFSVVAPSLPGFGFSSPPPAAGFSAAEVARLWDRLMRDGLGYERFVAHGSDLGVAVTARLARAAGDQVSAIHLATPGLAPGQLPRTADEDRYRLEAEAWMAAEGGYFHEHSTKPATLAAALTDSPAGLAAWIGEKVVSWSSLTPDGEPKFGRERLLSTLTLYWATGTIGSSMLPYWSYRHLPDSALSLDAPGPTPTTVAIFGGERVPFPKPPRALAERYFTVTRWEEHDCGGHFPAVAEPTLFAESLRAAFRPVR